MGLVYNRKVQKPVRQKLRNNATEPERLLWEKLRAGQMGVKFRRQHGIADRVVDFYCPAIHLAIEVDGESHFSVKGREHDQKLKGILDKLDICLLRFTNAEVRTDLDAVCMRIMQSIAELKVDHS